MIASPGALDVVWYCHADDIRHEINAGQIPYESWFYAPTTIICQDPEAFQFLDRMVEIGAGDVPPIALRQGFTQTECAVETVRAIAVSAAPYVHLRTRPFAAHPLSVRLLAGALEPRPEPLVSFDSVRQAGAAFWFPAIAFLRRHNLATDDDTLGELESCVLSRALIEHLKGDLLSVPATLDWHKLILRLAVERSGPPRHVPLLVGASARTHRKPHHHDVSLSLVSALLEREFGDLLSDTASAATRPSLAKTVLSLCLARTLPSSASEHVQRRLFDVFSAVWPTAAQSQVVSAQDRMLRFLCLLVDGLDLRVFDTVDLTVEAGRDALVQRLRTEAVLCDDPFIARVLFAVLHGLGAVSPSSVKPLDMFSTAEAIRHTVGQQRLSQDQALQWRAECARQADLLAAERVRNRLLVRRNADLQARLVELKNGATSRA